MKSDTQLSKLAIAIAIILISSNSALATGIPINTTIRSCGVAEGWPPYTYQTPDGDVAGYNLKLISKILTKHNLQSVMQVIAWKRCLKLVEEGKEYQIVLSASKNKDREKRFLLTRYYHEVTPSYFYLKSKYPNGPAIKTTKDLNQYRICGLLGYNYVHFGVANKTIDMGTQTFPQLVEKVSRGRCDLFLDRQESFMGFEFMGSKYRQDYNLGFNTIPDVPTEKFYMMISRSFPYAQELKKLIDKEVTEMESAGTLKILESESVAELKAHYSYQ